MSLLDEKVQGVAKEIVVEILKGKIPAEIARITQDEIDVILFPNTKAIEDHVDSIVSEAISEALKAVVVLKDSTWWT